MYKIERVFNNDFWNDYYAAMCHVLYSILGVHVVNFYLLPGMDGLSYNNTYKYPFCLKNISGKLECYHFENV